MRPIVTFVGCEAGTFSGGTQICGRKLRPSRRGTTAFTLIELMVVVGIMGLILAAGIPSLYKLMQKDGMRKVTSDLLEVCGKARAQAILRGTPVDLMFYPRERRIVVGGAATPEGDLAGVTHGGERPSITPGSGQIATIPDDFVLEMLDINLSEYKDSEWARARFFPNGTCDELTIIVRSPKNEWKKITTEVTTGLANVDEVVP